MTKKTKISLFFLLLPSFVLASDTLRVERVISVYDGDTFRVDINGLHPLIGKNIGIRVAGVDTPEIRGKCDREKALAQQAKLMTSQFVKRNTGSVELRNPSRGKYFRIVADVWANGQSLKRKLLDAKLAYPYNGGKKQSWCGS